MYPQRADIAFGTYKYEALSSCFIGRETLSLLERYLLHCVLYFRRARGCQETFKFMGKHMNAIELPHHYTNEIY